MRKYWQTNGGDDDLNFLSSSCLWGEQMREQTTQQRGPLMCSGFSVTVGQGWSLGCKLF
jgi:hypothetical protein